MAERRKRRRTKPKDYSGHPNFWLPLWQDRAVKVKSDGGVGILVGLQCQGRKRVPTPDQIINCKVARPWRVVQDCKPDEIEAGDEQDSLRYGEEERSFVIAAERHKMKHGVPVNMTEKVVIYDGGGRKLKVIERPRNGHA